MKVLIVETEVQLGMIWQRSLERLGCDVTIALSQRRAITHLMEHDVSVIVLNLVLSQGSALAVADFASYRRPEAKVVVVTDTTFFSDGSVFCHVANARAMLRISTPPDDLAAMVAHFGGWASGHA